MNGAEINPIGRRFRLARLRAGLSQQALAKYAGVGRAWISSVERGKIEPGGRRLDAVARRLDVSPRHIITGETEAGRDPDAEADADSTPTPKPTAQGSLCRASTEEWQGLRSVLPCFPQ